MIGLGARLAAARTARGLSQAQLAGRLHVTQVAVSHWETDRREPDLATLLALGGELHAPVQFLLGQQHVHPGTESAVTWWAGWRQGWLDCGKSVCAAAALRPDLMPQRVDAPGGEPDWMRAVHENRTSDGGR